MSTADEDIPDDKKKLHEIYRTIFAVRWGSRFDGHEELSWRAISLIIKLKEINPKKIDSSVYKYIKDCALTSSTAEKMTYFLETLEPGLRLKDKELFEFASTAVLPLHNHNEMISR